MKPKKNNKIIYIYVGVVAFLLLTLISFHMGTFYAEHSRANAITAFSAAINSITSNPFNFEITEEGFKTLGVFLFIGAVATALLIFDGQRNKQTMPGKESGSAKWNDNLSDYNKKYTEPFGQKINDGEGNMILTQNVFLSMNSKKTRMNNNILVIGGSGSGKSRFLVKPNVLQANSDYVITDPAGELLSSTAHFLENQKGYKIKVFNLVEMAKSDQYNPFNYIRDDLGVLMMINCLIKNTNPGGKSGGDPFWEKSETALLQALCFYLIKYCPKHQQNFTSVMKLLRAAEVDENDPTKKSKLDRIFDEVAVKDPGSIALKQYLTFKMGAGKTLKSILISCSVRLTVFNMKEIESLTKEDTIDLASFGHSDSPQALFVIIPAADDTYNFLVSMMYSQLFETLYYIGDTEYADRGSQLPRPVRFLLDEFANIGEIPGFTKKLATMRKYNISCTIILQGLAQLKTMYKDDWETVTSNCDSLLYLGGQELSTTKEISERLGKSTIIVRNNSRSRGGKGSSSLNFQRTGRELMSTDEIMHMPKDECILFINGLAAFYEKKFEYTKHKNYKYTGDANDKFKYINIKNNSDKKPVTDYDVDASRAKAEKYAKSDASTNPKDKIISKPIPEKTMMQSLNINTVNDLGKFEIKEPSIPSGDLVFVPTINELAIKKDNGVIPNNEFNDKSQKDKALLGMTNKPKKVNLKDDYRNCVRNVINDNDGDMTGEVFDYTTF